MGAVVFEQLKTLGSTRGPAQRPNRFLGNRLHHLTHHPCYGAPNLVSVHERPKLLESESASNGDGLSRVTSPQETIGVPAQRYDHYEQHQGTIARSLNMKPTSGVNEEHVLDFIHVTSNIQFVSKST